VKLTIQDVFGFYYIVVM